MLDLAIVGNGAIGNLLAWRAHQQQINYVTITRSGTSHSITCIDSTLSSSQSAQQIPLHCTKFHKLADVETLIIPVKAYQVLDALKQVATLDQSPKNIVLLHNGMLDMQVIRSVLPHSNILCATTSYGAFKPSLNELRLTGLGSCDLGWLDQRKPDEEAKTLLETLLPPCRWHQDIQLALWQKLAVNAVINPLTAIHKIKNGQLRESQYQAQINAICEELHALLQRLGYAVSAQDLFTRCWDVMSATAENQSSMLQDVLNGRRTEIEFINGHVVEQAHRLGVDVPVNRALTEAVLALN